MSKHQFQFPLNLKVDTNGEEYMIGSTDLPMSVDLREATFLVFFPEEGSDTGTLMIRPRNCVRPQRENPNRDHEEG